MSEIKIVGTFNDYSANHKVADISQVKDNNGKSQETINEELRNSISDAVAESVELNTKLSRLEYFVGETPVSTVVANAVANEASRATAAEENLSESIDDERQRAEAAESLLRDAYEALTQSNIVVGTLPAVDDAEVNTIYRVPGANSYTDYMFDGTDFVLMATYDNAIDDVPTGRSDNLVKSGGVNKAINDTVTYVSEKLSVPYVNFHYSSGEGKTFEATIGETIELNNSSYYKVYKKDIPENAVSLTGRFVGRIAAKQYIALTDENDVVLSIGYADVSTDNALTDISISIPKGAVYCYMKTYGSGLWHSCMLTFHVAGDFVDNDSVEVDSDTGVMKRRTVLPYIRLQKYIRNNGTTTWGFYDGVNAYYSAVFNVSEFVGKTLNVRYDKYSNGSAVVFCEDYTLIGTWSSQTHGEYIDGWTDNVIETISVPTGGVVVPQGAVYMIVCLSSTNMPLTYCLDATDDIALKSDVDTAVDTIWNALDGTSTIGVESIRNGSLVRTPRLRGFGLWFNRTNFKGYIFDVSNIQDGEIIQITGAVIENYYAYVFLKSTTLSTESDWNAAYDSEWDTDASYSKQVKPAQVFSLDVKKPAGALYCVVAGYTDEIVPSLKISVNKSSVYARLSALEGEDGTDVNEKEWVKSERERIEALIEKLTGHELVIWGFNTDQHLGQGSGTEAVKRGLACLKNMAERNNFDLIVLGGDESSQNHDPLGRDAKPSIINDIRTVANAVETNVCPVVSIAGNHDAAHNAGNNIDSTDERKSFWKNDFNDSTIYRYKTQRVVNKKQVAFSAPGGTNLIIDDSVKKCRYIFVDGWSRKYRESNNTVYKSGYEENGVWHYWFVEVLRIGLSDEKLFNSDWKVYLFSHNVLPPAGDDAQNAYAPVFDNMASEWNNIIETALTNGVNIVVGVNGHCHNVAWRTDHNIVFCSTGSASIKNSTQNNIDGRYYSHDLNTPTESLFDVYVHDITDERIYAFAYGAPSDRIWDISGQTPALLLCDLTVIFDTEQSLVGAKATASYHNTTFEVTADGAGHFNFPYLTPEREWLISITLDGSEEGVDDWAYTTAAGTYTLTID